MVVMDWIPFSSPLKRKANSLRLACESGHDEQVEQLLSEQGRNDARKRQKVLDATDKYGWTPLHYACWKGHVNIATQLVTHGATVNIPNKDQKTPLYLACHFKNEEIVKLLLEKQMDQEINSVKDPRDGWTLLHLCCKFGLTVIAHLLVAKYGANVNATSVMGQSPLFLASIKGNMEMVKLLLQQSGIRWNEKDANHWTPLDWAMVVESQGSDRKDIVKEFSNLQLHQEESRETRQQEDLSETPGAASASSASSASTDGDEPASLHDVCRRDGNVTNVEFFLSRGDPVDGQDKHGCTPLQYASKLGHVDVVKKLLEHNAQVNLAGGKDNRTPLHFASESGHDAVVMELIKGIESVISKEMYHESLNSPDGQGDTPLHLAGRNRHVAVVRLLLKAGADDTAKNKMGEVPPLYTTPLHGVCLGNGDKSLVRHFLDRQDPVNAIDEAGFTPLHHACSRGNVEAVKELLDGGAQVNVVSMDKETPLHLATYYGRDNVVKELLDNHSASVDMRGKNNDTPLHFACQNGYTTIVQRLLNAGSEIHASNQQGMTPLHSAVGGFNGDPNAEGMGNETALQWEKDTSFHRSAEHALLYQQASAHDVRGASTPENKSVLQLLMQKGANVNAKDKNMDTPLHYACRRGNREAVQLLLENGAETIIKNTQEKTPWELAKHHHEIRSLLKKKIEELAGDSWQHDAIIPLVPTYPLKMTNVSVSLEEADQATVTARLSKCFKRMSVEAKYFNDPAHAVIVTWENVELAVNLWSKENEIVVEVQRRRGDTAVFHKYARHIMDAAARPEAESEGSAELASGDFNVDSLKSADKVLKNISPKRDDQVKKGFRRAVKNIFYLINNKKHGRADTKIIVMERLSVLVDPRQTGIVMAVLFSRALLLGGSAVEEGESAVEEAKAQVDEIRHIFISAIADRSGEFDHGSDKDPAVETLGLMLLMKSLEVFLCFEKEGAKHREMASNISMAIHELSPTRDMLYILKDALVEARAKPHNACRSAICLRLLCETSDEKILQEIKDLNVGNVADAARNDAGAIHSKLDRECKKLSDAVNQRQGTFVMTTPPPAPTPATWEAPELNTALIKQWVWVIEDPETPGGKQRLVQRMAFLMRGKNTTRHVPVVLPQAYYVPVPHPFINGSGRDFFKGHVLKYETELPGGQVVFREDPQEVVIKRIRTWIRDPITKRLVFGHWGAENPYYEIAAMRFLNPSCEQGHPTLACLDALCDSKYIYIVTPFLNGGDVHDHIFGELHPPISERTARVVFRKILQQVQYLHEQGVVHGDLKGENIGMQCLDSTKPNPTLQDMDPVLIDFAQSHPVIPRDISRTLIPAPPGTASFRAPEVQQYGTLSIRNAFAIDIWSLGIILFNLLTEERLYMSPFDVVYKHFITNEGLVSPSLNQFWWHHLSSPRFQHVIQAISLLQRPKDHDEYYLVRLERTIPAVERLGPLVRNLLRGILEAEPDKRLTLSEVQSHAWLHIED